MATGAAVAVLGPLGFDLEPARAEARSLHVRWQQELTSVCNFCAVGCGLVVHSENGDVVEVEGNPDSPMNAGSLCAKGSAILQEHTSPQRLTKVLYRAPYDDKWQEKDWGWALDRIAQRIKQVRDETWETTNAAGVPVNRTQAIAAFGSAVLNNEECYLLTKFDRGLGLVYMDHQARI